MKVKVEISTHYSTCVLHSSSTQQHICCYLYDVIYLVGSAGIVITHGSTDNIPVMEYGVDASIWGRNRIMIR